MLSPEERARARQIFEIITERRLPWQLSQTAGGRIAIRVAGARGAALATLPENPSYAEAMSAALGAFKAGPPTLSRSQAADLVGMLWAYVGMRAGG